MYLARVVLNLHFFKLHFLVGNGQHISQFIGVAGGNLRVRQLLRLYDGEHGTVGRFKRETIDTVQFLTRCVGSVTAYPCDKWHSTKSTSVNSGE